MSNETKASPHYSVLVLMRKPWVQTLAAQLQVPSDD